MSRGLTMSATTVDKRLPITKLVKNLKFPYITQYLHQSTPMPQTPQQIYSMQNP